MSKKYQRDDVWRNTFWQDEDGNREYEREDVWGDNYREDKDGNREYEREDVWGNNYREDKDGNREYEREDVWGNNYREDNDGNRTYTRTDFWGNTYEESDDDSGGCFLTTACTSHAGLPDDCHELTTLRAFRDTRLRGSAFGERLLWEYYENAPKILLALRRSESFEDEMEELYETIKAVVRKVEAHQFGDAMYLYSSIYVRLASRYL